MKVLFNCVRLALMLGLASLLASPAAVAQVGPKDFKFGIVAYAGPVHYEFEAAQYGGMEVATVFKTLGKWDVLPYARIDRVHEIVQVINIPQLKGKDTLDEILGGTFDANLRHVRALADAHGVPVIWRFMHELNLKGKYLGVNPDAGRPAAKVRQAWIHIAEILGCGTAYRCDFNVNRSDGDGKTFAVFRDIYPGDKLVYRVTTSNYNRCGTHDKYFPEKPGGWKSFESQVALSIDEMIKVIGPNVRVGIAEMSSHHGCGVDWSQWWRDALAYIERNPRITFATLFLEDKKVGSATNTTTLLWGPQNKAEKEALRKAIAAFRQKRGIKPPPIGLASGQGDIKVVWSAKDVVVTPAGQKQPAEVPKSVFERITGADVTDLEWFVMGTIEASPIDDSIPAINPATGKPFGPSGLVARFRARSALVIDPNFKDFDLELKPGIWGEIVKSTNPNRSWENFAAGGFRLDLCPKIAPKFADHNRFCIWGKIGGRYYLAPAPQRLQEQGKDVDVLGKIGVGFQAGARESLK